MVLHTFHNLDLRLYLLRATGLTLDSSFQILVLPFTTNMTFAYVLNLFKWYSFHKIGGTL